VLGVYKPFAMTAYRTAVGQELATPLRPALANKLLWYFERQATPLTDGDPQSARFVSARQAFDSRRYRVLYGPGCRTVVDDTVSRSSLTPSRGALVKWSRMFWHTLFSISHPWLAQPEARPEGERLGERSPGASVPPSLACERFALSCDRGCRRRCTG